MYLQFILLNHNNMSFRYFPYNGVSDNYDFAAQRRSKNIPYKKLPFSKGIWQILRMSLITRNVLRTLVQVKCLNYSITI